MTGPDPTREIVGAGVVLDDDAIELLFAPPPTGAPIQHDGEA